MASANILGRRGHGRRLPDGAARGIPGFGALSVMLFDMNGTAVQCSHTFQVRRTGKQKGVRETSEKILRGLDSTLNERNSL
jgi:hypothetical protein